MMLCKLGMASMVAKACSSSSSQMPSMIVQEKGSRNKRKFRADPPLADPNKIIPLPPPNESTSFEFSAKIFEMTPSHGHKKGCDVCCVNRNSSDALKLDLGLSCTVETPEIGSSRLREETEASSDDADWSDLTETQLEELVLSNLDTIFKSALKKIIASGYSEEVATKAILRSGLWYGCKDTVSNLVDNALAFLTSGQDIEPSNDYYFADLQQMEKYILAELVCLLKEVRPFFSTGDAMWCLLICDMNVSHACAMDTDHFGGFLGDFSSNMNSSISARHQLKTDPISSESDISIPCKLNAAAHGGHSLLPEVPNITDCPKLKPKSSFVLNGVIPQKECQNSVSVINEKPFSAAGISHSRKVNGTAGREHILRQKSTHLEKHYRKYCSKGTTRPGKLSTFGGLALDKKLKAVAASTGLNAKNPSFKIGKGVAFDVSQDTGNHNLSTSNGLISSVPTFGLDTIDGNSSLLVAPVNSAPQLPMADTELSLSLPAKSIANPMPISDKIELGNCDYVGSSNDRSHGPSVHSRKDEMILKLVPRVRELQNQLQEWTEWANQKVMQAARRLSKDKAELKTLKQEKEEVERLKKEKQMLEENTMKKLSEMENALRKASGQVGRANAAVRRLDVENGALRQEMEAAKLRAAESAATYHEVSKREKKTLMKFQSWEKQKAVFQDELAAEKRKLMELQSELQQAKDVRNQAEARLNQEENAKNELLAQASSFKKEREQIEVSTKSKEDMIKLNAENNLKKYKEDIARLEKEISQLRLKTDSSKIAALKRGIDGSYASKVTDVRNTSSPKNFAVSHISSMATSTDLQDFTEKVGVKRERECVMCLSEEMSVVFLPCAHQVVCTMCNELHEKQGMKDCPSCRSPIQRRVCVRYAAS